MTVSFFFLFFKNKYKNYLETYIFQNSAAKILIIMLFPNLAAKTFYLLQLLKTQSTDCLFKIVLTWTKSYTFLYD